MCIANSYFESKREKPRERKNAATKVKEGEKEIEVEDRVGNFCWGKTCCAEKKEVSGDWGES